LLTLLDNTKSFTDRIVANIMRQLLAAVDYCHKKNIVHRDLKPDNILFEQPDIESTLKVIDFGRSKLIEPNQKLLEKAGSVYIVHVLNELCSYIM